MAYKMGVTNHLLTGMILQVVSKTNVELLWCTSILNVAKYCVYLKWSNDSDLIFHMALFTYISLEYGTLRTALSKLLELLDTQVEGSVQWVLLEISWNIEPFL